MLQNKILYYRYVTNITVILQLYYSCVTNKLKLDENTVTFTLTILQTCYIYYNNITEILQLCYRVNIGKRHVIINVDEER